MPTIPSIAGVVLAGGRARRMGGQDKGLIPLAGRPLITHVLAALTPQVARVLINANRNLEAYAAYGHTVVTDTRGDYPGPLAGMASALAALQTGYLVTCPCDTPFVPADLVTRLWTALRAGDAQLAVAHNGDRLQPVFCLLHTDLSASLQEFLDDGGRKIDSWFGGHRVAQADFSDRPETFININTPEDVQAAEARLAGQP